MARDDPCHALELLEAVGVGNERLSPIPERKQNKERERPHPPDEPVAHIRVRRQSAHTEGDMQRRQHVNAVRQKHKVRYLLRSPCPQDRIHSIRSCIWGITSHSLIKSPPANQNSQRKSMRESPSNRALYWQISDKMAKFRSAHVLVFKLEEKPFCASHFWQSETCQIYWHCFACYTSHEFKGSIQAPVYGETSLWPQQNSHESHVHEL